MNKDRSKTYALFFIIGILGILALWGGRQLAKHIIIEKHSREIEQTVSNLLHKFEVEPYMIVKQLSKFENLYSYHGEGKFPAASLIKIPLMVVALNAVKEGKIALDKEVVINKEDIAPGSGILKYNKLPKKFSLLRILEYMITQSDNTAANKIIDILGREYINETFSKLNLVHTQLNRKILDFKARNRGIENYTSCKDLVYLLEMLYHHRLLNRGYSELMLSFLINQKIEDRIPKYIPANTVVANKTGLEKTVVGDTGIIFNSCGDYLLCVAVTKFPNYKKAKEFIARVSEFIYNTYQKECNLTRAK